MFSTRDNLPTQKKTLRLFLLMFFVLLSIPVGILINKVYTQLEKEALVKYRGLAEEISYRINDELARVLEIEEARPFEDYSFFKLEENKLLNTEGLAVSPLASYPPLTETPAVIGYFQIDPDGKLQLPSLPELADSFDENSVGKYKLAAFAEQEELKKRLGTLLAKSIEPEEAAPKPEAEKIVEEAAVAKTPSILDRFNDFTSGGRKDTEPTATSQADVPQKMAEKNLNVLFRKKKKQAYVDSIEVASKGKASKSNLASEDNWLYRSLEKTSPKRRSSRSRKVQVKVPAQKEASEAYQTQSLSAAVAQGGMVDYSKLQAPKSVSPPAGEFDLKVAGVEGVQQRVQEDKRINASSIVEEDLISPGKVSDKEEQREEKKPTRQADPNKSAELKILTFEGEIEPFSVRIESESLIFYRRIWRERKLYVQGFVVDSLEFIESIAEPIFETSSLAKVSSLKVLGPENFEVKFEGEALTPKSSRRTRDLEGEGKKVYSGRFIRPLNTFGMDFIAKKLVVSASSSRLADILVGSIAFVLIAGLLVLYKIGVRFITLAKERSDFVSAVSHELKTPLTSIRMYGEMLRSGWVEDEEKKKSYYDFIFFESERLSRLIGNVLQLSKLTNNETELELKNETVGSLIDLIKSKVSTQAEVAEFDLEFSPFENGVLDKSLSVDDDSFTRVFINLVDNAIKFSNDSETKKVVINAKDKGSEVQFSVRDFGPGIEKDKLKKIFQLFYRSEDELTRTTPGTGIGLALVNELVRKMNGNIDARNANPGAEFIVSFPIK